MNVCKETEVVVLENTAEQPIEVIFQDEVQLDINVPLFYIKSGEEEIQSYVDKQAKPQIDDYAAQAFADFQSEVDAETEKACQRVSDYVENTACSAVQSYVADVACPTVQSYVAQEIEPDLVQLVNISAASAAEAGGYAGQAQVSEQAATAQAGAAAESESEASACAAEALASAQEAAAKLAQVQEIAAEIDVENLVHKSGDEVMNGTKTFLASPLVPTPDISSNAAFPATTEWIANKFQVVSALPTSPDDNVFYFIKEN